MHVRAVSEYKNLEMHCKHIDRTAAVCKDRNRQPGRQQEKQTEKRERLEDSTNPGLGVVDSQGWRADGVEVSILVNESSLGAYSLEFPCRTAAVRGRKNTLHRQVERV